MTKQEEYVMSSDDWKIERLALRRSALKYLLQWRNNEKNLVEQIEGAKTTYEKAHVMKKALRYFQVSRNLSGFGAMSDEEKLESYKSIYTLAQNSATKFSGARIDAVIELENKLGKRLGIKSSLLSASSKLIWLFTQKNPIFDSWTRKALFLVDDKDYKVFAMEWKKEYKKYESEIDAVCLELFELMRDYYGEDVKDIQEINKKWFRERVFDKYLMREAQDMEEVDD